jgi:hypothetical protein
MWTLTNAIGSLYDGYWDRATRQAAVITLSRAVLEIERELTPTLYERKIKYQN